MKIKTSHYRLLFLTIFAIAYTGSATFFFTERPSAQKIKDGFTFKTGQADPEAGMIQGTVYIDFNMNGARNLTGVAPDIAVDDGIGGITVTAYAANGASVATMTAADGSYSLTTTALPAGPYRIEFTGLPSGYSPSYYGTNNGSTVRFVPDGSQTGIDLGVVNAVDEYCQNEPEVVTPRWQNGNLEGNTTPSLTTVPWGTLSRTNSANTDLSTLAQIGTTWATAYKKDKQWLFTASFLRRHSGFGPRGIGGVYVRSFADGSVGSFDLQGAAGIDLGSVNRVNVPGDIQAGAAGDYEIGPSAFANRDLDAFDKVGKVSFGDAEIQPNTPYLWLVNLNQRALIKVDTSLASNLSTDPTDAGMLAIRNSAIQYPLSGMSGQPTCSRGVFRPFAIKFYNGLGYLGGTCTAENESGPAGTAANLRAEVLSFNPANPTALTSVISTTLVGANMRENTESGFGTGWLGAWKPWRSTWNDVVATDAPNYYEPDSAPLLANIEFSQNGSIILGIMDRVSAQAGRINFAAVSGSTQTYSKKGSGDISMICRIGASWVKEGTGACTVQDNTPFSTPAEYYGDIEKDGDGLGDGGEFFRDDFYLFGVKAGPDTGGGHGEVALGGLVTYPGADQIVTTAYDPVFPDSRFGTDYVNAQGLIYFNSTNGSRIGYPANPTNRYDSVNGAGYLMVPEAAGLEELGKSLGLGEPDLLCNSAPLQIGNRIWRDADFDGVQDPDELPIAGVTVNLYDSNGTLIATAVTDVNGQYYFVSGTAVDSNPADMVGIVNGDILPNSTYQIRVDNPLDYQSGGPLFGNMLTRSNAVGQAGEDELSDSDGVMTLTASGTYPVSIVNTGEPGANTHVYDFGFLMVPLSAEATVSGRVFTAKGRPIVNATVVLTESDGTIYRSVTGSFGYFTFTRVRAGRTVLVDVSADKRTFREPTILVTVGGDVSDVNFFANN